MSHTGKYLPLLGAVRAASLPRPISNSSPWVSHLFSVLQGSLQWELPPCLAAFFKDIETLHSSFTLLMKGHNSFLTNLLTILWDWFLKQPEYEPSTDLFFNFCQEVFHPPPDSRKAANREKKPQTTNIKTSTGSKIHLFLFTSTGRMTHLFLALFTTSIFQPVHDTKHFLLAQ